MRNPEKLKELDEKLDLDWLKDNLKERVGEEQLFGQPPQYEIIITFNRLVQAAGSENFEKAVDLAKNLKGAMKVVAHAKNEKKLPEIDRTFRTLTNILKSDRPPSTKSRVVKGSIGRVKKLIQNDLELTLTPIL
ncbi:hypothetical protein AKJ56_01100 [candidate division MSBL1 archaeon SCGC-AAA382N08]|uniref:Uncharacterized protein n=1 Tax=candidate division MSBL1 archaeon SCGC-AAA382N08 TaxID=1698285 RepID=A0A133VQ19_9EURY|nr:hypothetical protein AKJ56_01100 [candidate division MSBL1 archaeon SCGC-AAA382N08]